MNITAEETCGLGADFKLSDANLGSGVFFITVAVLGLPGNILVTIICSKNTSVMYRTYMLTLAIVDTTICVFYIVSSILDMVTWSNNQGEIRCPFSFTNVIFCTCLTFSIFVLTLISVDRYLAVQSPIKHRERSKHFWRILALLPIPAFILSVVLALLEFLWIPYLNEVAALLPFLTCCIIITVMYSLLAYKLYKRQKQRTHAVIPALIIIPLPIKRNPNAKFERLAKTLFIVTVAFVVSWLPFWLVTMGVGLPCALKETFIMNSVMNPIIYAFMWEPFREDVKALCFCSKTTKVQPFDDTS